MSKSEKKLSEAESLAKANEEIQGEIQARFDAQNGSSAVSEMMVPVDFSAETAITLVNLQANPMSALGLESYGEVSVTVTQMACPRFAGKVQRAIDLGLIKVK